MDQYILKHKIADATNGTIGLYEDIKQLNEQVAIKSVRITPEIKHERKVHKQLCKNGGHPSILRLRKSIRKHSTMHFVVDYCCHGDLYDLVQEDVLNLSITRQYFSQIVHAIKFMHDKGYAHRDLSLENILLHSDDQCVLADFGFAVPAYKIQRARVGKISYMAPEVVKGNEYLPAQTDMWSLGVVLFTLCTGHPPVEIASVEDERMVLLKQHGIKELLKLWDTQLPEEVVDILDNLLRANTMERWNISTLQKHPWILEETPAPESPNNLATYFQKLFGI